MRKSGNERTTKPERKKKAESGGGSLHGEQLSIVPGVTVIGAVFFALFVGMLFLLQRVGMLPPYLHFLFPNQSEAGEETLVEGAVTLSTESDFGFSEEVFLTPDYSLVSKEDLPDVLRAIVPCLRYRQELVRESDGLREAVTILRDGARYRVEKEGKLVICDGESVYVRTDWYEYTYAVDGAGGRFTPESEAGIPDAEAVASEIASAPSSVTFSFDERDKILMVEYEGGSYGISLESGLVLTETAVRSPTTDGGTAGEPEPPRAYRMYTTFYTIDPDFPDGIFVIPEESGMP